MLKDGKMDKVTLTCVMQKGIAHLGHDNQAIHKHLPTAVLKGPAGHICNELCETVKWICSFCCGGGGSTGV
jgi:hypothetical protein